MATVIIPTPLRKFTNNTTKLTVQATTISELIEILIVDFPELKKHLLDANGKVPSFINIFVDDDDIRAAPLDEFRADTRACAGCDEGIPCLPVSKLLLVDAETARLGTLKDEIRHHVEGKDVSGASLVGSGALVDNYVVQRRGSRQRRSG